MKVQLILAVDAESTGSFGPDPGSAEEVRGGRGELWEVVVDVPGSIRCVNEARDELRQIVDAGNLNVPHGSKEVALIAGEVFGQFQAESLLFVVQVDQVLYVIPGAPIRLDSEKGL